MKKITRWQFYDKTSAFLTEKGLFGTKTAKKAMKKNLEAKKSGKPLFLASLD